MVSLPVNISDSYPDSAADASIALHQEHHDIIHAAINKQVSKGDLVFNLRDQPDVVGDGKTDDSLALQAALEAASVLGARAFANGTFKTTRSLRITGSADLSDATIRFYGEGTAVEVGTSGTNSFRKTVLLPRVIAASKTALGWGQVLGTVGVLVQNSSNLDLTVSHIQSFETGLVIAGYGKGTAYCNVTLGHLDNNKRNLRFTADADGWANQNNFFGGRLSHNSGEGTLVPGCRHVLIDETAHRVNNNTFWGTSLESANGVEYHVDCAGFDNYFMNCRWENRESGARVIWRKGSAGNIISYGNSAHAIVETFEAGTANLLLSRASNRMAGNGGGSSKAVLSVENTWSSSLPAVRIMEAGANSSGQDQNATWAMEISALKLRGKRATDMHERVSVDNANGRVYVGSGVKAPTKYFGAVGDMMGFDGGSVCFATDNAHDLGTSLNRPRYIRAGTGIQTGVFRRSSRPSAKAAGAGTSIFDSTLKKPIWSTGKAWVDAMGRVV